MKSNQANRAIAVSIALLTSIFTTPLHANTPAHDRAQWYQILKWPQSCEETYQKTLGKRESPLPSLRFFVLDSTYHLVEVICYGGAYQPGLVFIQYQPKLKTAQVLHWPGFSKPIINALPTFDAKTKTLELFNKGIGVGGCGQWVQYQWQPDAMQFGISRATARSCMAPLDETMPLNPKQWPQVLVK